MQKEPIMTPILITRPDNGVYTRVVQSDEMVGKFLQMFIVMPVWMEDPDGMFAQLASTASLS
jgi:hypothetical protein